MPTSERSGATNRNRNTEDRSILIAVEPPSFQRLIQHVLHGQSGLKVVGGEAPGSSAREAARLAPDVIIVNHRLGRREGRDVLIDLRRSSPSSTLILLTHFLGAATAPQVADVWLPEDAVVRQLLPAIRKTVSRAPHRVSRPASAAPRP